VGIGSPLPTVAEFGLIRRPGGGLFAEAEAEAGRSILTHQHFLCEASDREGFSREDSAFHMAMYRMAGVGGLWRNVRSMRAHLTRLRMLDIPQPGTMKSIICEHEAIWRRSAPAMRWPVKPRCAATFLVRSLRSKL
jgi:FCD domain